MTLPYQRHSETSRQAADLMIADANKLRAAVYRYIKGCGARGATDEEVQLALALGGNTERPRRRELQQAGRIEDSGEQRVTRSGRKAVVWIAVDEQEPRENELPCDGP